MLPNHFIAAREIYFTIWIWERIQALQCRVHALNTAGKQVSFKRQRLTEFGEKPFKLMDRKLLIWLVPLQLRQLPPKPHDATRHVAHQRRSFTAGFLGWAVGSCANWIGNGFHKVTMPKAATKSTAIVALLAASLSACAVPDVPKEPARLSRPCRCAPMAAPVKLAPVPFRTLDRATERAIEPPGLEPLVVTNL